MALEQKLSLRLTQRLVMTPSLQQAIKLLQLTRMELQTSLNEQLVENPVLEEREEDAEEETPKEEEERTAETADEMDHEKSMEDVDLEAYFNDYWESSSYTSQHLGVPEAPPLENTLTRQPDLYDHLLWQIHMLELPERIRTLCELIVGNLDPDGFLVASDEEIRQMGDDDPDGAEPFGEEEVAQAQALVRGLDPPGIGCTDLRQSLLLQLRLAGVPEDGPTYRMLDEHWELFLKRQFPTIARSFGIDLSELEPIVERIKTLETRPGRKFTTDRTHYVEPDVVVAKVGDEYVIQLNDDGLPRLRVSGAYRRMLQKLRKDGGQVEAHEFLREKMRSALWLIKSLDQRQRTIYKVATSIVKQQEQFLDRGIEHLRPMVLRDVAEDIGMHESTVSRVVSNKYIHTPRGLLPMKFFFHSGIDRAFGEDISSLTVKRKIEGLIGDEEPKKPLSDSALARALHREGIHIARRTVAKYRDELGIPSSTERKQIF